jgi:methionine-gamma-lyase
VCDILSSDVEKNSKKGLMTRLTHSGGNEAAKRTAQSVSVPKVVPIYMSSVFSFDDVPSLDGVYDGTQKGYVYSRMANPNYDALNEVLTQAEGCDGAVSFGSGMAAIVTAFLANVSAGDHIVASPVLYGGVYDYLKNEAPRFGIEADFVDFENDDLERHMKPNTKVVYTETITNPLMEVPDLRKAAETAHRHGAKLIVDNTFATPVICRPLEFGADIVVYSATKYLGGHSDLTCGVVLSGAENISRVQKLATLYGGIPGPFDAWLLTRSLRTLELRVRQHSDNAQKLAEYFEKHPKVEKVYYPGLPSSPSHAVAAGQFDGGLFGGMLSADIVGGEGGASRFIAACESVKFVPSLAGVTTSISYPAKTSHRAYTREEMDRCGISMGQLRFSAGLERIEDVIAEFDRAFASV